MLYSHDIEDTDHYRSEFYITAVRELNERCALAAGVPHYIPALWTMTNLQQKFLRRVQLELIVAFD